MTPRLMICPHCDASDVPLVTVREVSICGKCGGSSVTGPDGHIRASDFHIATLSPQEIAILRHARGTVPGVRRAAGA